MLGQGNPQIEDQNLSSSSIGVDKSYFFDVKSKAEYAHYQSLDIQHKINRIDSEITKLKTDMENVPTDVARIKERIEGVATERKLHEELRSVQDDFNNKIIERPTKNDIRIYALLFFAGVSLIMYAPQIVNYLGKYINT